MRVMRKNNKKCVYNYFSQFFLVKDTLYRCLRSGNPVRTLRPFLDFRFLVISVCLLCHCDANFVVDYELSACKLVLLLKTGIVPQTTGTAFIQSTYLLPTYLLERNISMREKYIECVSHN